MRRTTLSMIGAFLLASAGVAAAFGTINSLGQNSEHERITRHALACGQGLPGEICFQPKTVDEIAGRSGTFGAVGAPDNPTRGLMGSSEAHCDNGDWVDTPGYPNTKSKAQAQLTACRTGMNNHMNDAVTDAARLLKSNGSVDDSQIPTFVSCTYNGTKGRAKCNVLEDLGLVLHASEDFYSHSNWSDRAGPGAVTLENPRGLDNAGPAPWLDLDKNVPFPDGLITGCFDTLSNISSSAGCPGHVKHYYLNKDKGTIDPQIGQGTTPRGQIGDNFRKAVQAAISDTRSKIFTLRSRLIARYGQAKADKMMCAISHDDPAKTCR